MKELAKKDILSQLKKLGAEQLPDTKTHIHRMKIRSETSDREYIVSKRNTNIKRVECSCPGWIFRRNCKHVRAIAPPLKRVFQDKQNSVDIKQIVYKVNLTKKKSCLKKKSC